LRRINVSLSDHYNFTYSTIKLVRLLQSHLCSQSCQVHFAQIMIFWSIMHDTAHDDRSSNYFSSVSLRHETFSKFKHHQLVWHFVQAVTNFLFEKPRIWILSFYTECRVRKYLHIYILGNRIMISSNDVSDLTCITLHTSSHLILDYRCRTCISTCYNHFRVSHYRFKTCRQRCDKSIDSLRFERLFQAEKLIAEFIKNCITDLFCIFMTLCKHFSLKIVI